MDEIARVERYELTGDVIMVCAVCGQAQPATRPLWAVWDALEGCWYTEYLNLGCGHFWSHRVQEGHCGNIKKIDY